MRQPPSQVLPKRWLSVPEPTPARGLFPAGNGVLAPAQAGAIPIGRFPSAGYVPSMGISVLDQRAPRAPRTPVKLRVSSWRSRNWRRALATWFVLSFALMAEAAHLPGPLFDAAGVLVAATPVLLATLP
jgi:hypothetical protein